MIYWANNGTTYQIRDLRGSDTDFQSSPISDTLVYAGTGESEYHLLGFTPARRSIQAQVVGRSAYRGLLAARGQSGTFSDGEDWTSLTARLVEFGLQRMTGENRGDDALYQGQLVFELAAEI